MDGRGGTLITHYTQQKQKQIQKSKTTKTNPVVRYKIFYCDNIQMSGKTEGYKNTSTSEYFYTDMKWWDEIVRIRKERQEQFEKKLKELEQTDSQK